VASQSLFPWIYAAVAWGLIPFCAYVLVATAILLWVDLGRALKNPQSRRTYSFGVIAVAFPQLVVGVVCLCLGFATSLICVFGQVWKGGPAIPALLLVVALVCIGIYCVKSARKRLSTKASSQPITKSVDHGRDP
jgi:hypothetical protein